MTIVTKDPHMRFVVTDPKSGKKQSVYNNETPKHNYPFAFQVPFSNGPTPQTNTVTLYNMSKEHFAFYHKKFKAQLYFGWGSSDKLLTEGYITKIDSTKHDGVTDSRTVYFKEGTDYSNVKASKLKFKKTKKVNKYKTVKVHKKGYYKKTRERYTTTETYKEGKRKGQKHTVGHYRYKKKWVKATTKNKRVKTRATKTQYVNRTFKKGTLRKKIIQEVAAKGDIKLAKIELKQNKPIKKSLTMSGKPLTLLQNLVKDCKSKMIRSKGKLEIINPEKVKRTWIEIDDKDLIEEPTTNESDSGEKTTYEISTPLIPEAGPEVGVIMNSKYLKGKFYISAGQDSNDGENPTTQCTLVAL